MRWAAPLALAASVALAAFSPSALARTFTVTRNDDPTPSRCKTGDCSLREAVIIANQRSGNDIIDFAGRLSGKTILLAGSSLVLHGTLTIDGPGASKLTISANDQSRIFRMTGGRVTIRGIKITEGRESAVPNGPICPGAGANAYTAGGGILQDAGSLKLDRVKVSNNAVDGPSGSIIGGGGIADIGGSLTMTHSRVTQNAVLGGSISGGGGILNCVGQVTVKGSAIHDSAVSSEAIGIGGAIANGLGSAQSTGTLELKKSTVAGNNTSSKAISQGGGIGTTGGPVDIDASTINDNSATVVGGGAISDGGGVIGSNSKVTVTNSTITNNLAIAPIAAGGGFLVGGTDGKLKLQSSTLVGNTADGTTSSHGGNLAGSSTANLLNTIVAKGKATTGSNCDGAVKSSGHDMEDKDTCGFNGKGDRVNKNPKVRDLAQNGGPTETIALKRDSPAIDHASKKSSPKRDQRGFKRDGKPDIGAYEFGAKP